MKKFLALFFIFIFVIGPVHVNAEQLDLSNADSCILIDSKTGAVLYEKNPDRAGFPASTTKIMTAVLALERGKLDQVMTASQEAIDDIGKDGMNIGIMAGEEIKLDNLLDALLISSANETANIIAENICSTRQEFVDLMNQKAKDLGCTNTHFVNPCGAQNKDHYTTASDLAKIARYAMTFQVFRDKVQQKTYQMLPTNKHTEWPVLASTNNLLKRTKSELFTINGIKTGYTVPAGHCLVSSAINGTGMDLIAVVMGVRNDNAKNNILEYSKKLLTYGFENYSLHDLVEPGKLVRNVAIEGAADGAYAQAIAAGSIEAVMPVAGSVWDVKEEVDIKPDIKAPVKKGDVLGSIEYIKGNVTLGKTDLVAEADVAAAPSIKVLNSAKKGFPFILKILIYTAIAIGSFVLLRIGLRRLSRTIRTRNRA